MTWDRKNRQEALLKEKIAIIVQQRLNDPRIGFVTITRAALSKAWSASRWRSRARAATSPS